jgi:hypothetical protein
MKRTRYIFLRIAFSLILAITCSASLTGCAALKSVGTFFANLGEGVGKVVSSVGDWVQKGVDYVKPMVDKGKEIAKKYEDSYKALKEIKRNGENFIDDVQDLFKKGQRNGGTFNPDPNKEATDEIDFPLGETSDEMDTFRAVEERTSSFRKEIDGFARRIQNFPSELKSQIQKDLNGINQGLQQGLQAVSKAGKDTGDALKQFEQAVSGIERVTQKIQEQENYAKGLNSGLESLIPTRGNNPAPLQLSREALEKRAQEVEERKEELEAQAKAPRHRSATISTQDVKAFSDAAEAYKRAINDRSHFIGLVTATKSEVEKADKKLEATHKEWKSQILSLETTIKMTDMLSQSLIQREQDILRQMNDKKPQHQPTSPSPKTNPEYTQKVAAIDQDLEKKLEDLNKKKRKAQSEIDYFNTKNGPLVKTYESAFIWKNNYYLLDKKLDAALNASREEMEAASKIDKPEAARAAYYRIRTNLEQRLTEIGKLPELANDPIAQTHLASQRKAFNTAMDAIAKDIQTIHPDLLYDALNGSYFHSLNNARAQSHQQMFDSLWGYGSKTLEQAEEYEAIKSLFPKVEAAKKTLLEVDREIGQAKIDAENQKKNLKP